MIDLHCHPLPGVDDGPATTEHALAMLRRAQAAGIRTMVATPHISPRYPDNRAGNIGSAVVTLQAQAAAADVDVRLLPGAELDLMHREVLREEELPGLRLGGGPYTLVELPFTATARFAEMLLGMHHDVQPALLAHPERCYAFQEDPGLLARLVDSGMLTQISAASILGSFGSTVQRSAWWMLEQGLVHVVATDAHDAVRRPPILREPLEKSGLHAVIGTLCEDNPAAILAGARPEPAPPVKPPRSLRRARGRRRF